MGSLLRDNKLRQVELEHRQNLAGADLFRNTPDAAFRFWQAAEVQIAEADRLGKPWLPADSVSATIPVDVFQKMMSAWETHFGGSMDDPEVQKRIDATVQYLKDNTA